MFGAGSGMRDACLALGTAGVTGLWQHSVRLGHGSGCVLAISPSRQVLFWQELRCRGAGAARGHGGSAGTGAQHRGANTLHAWTRGGCRLSCRRARLVRAELPALRAPGVRRAGTAPRVFSTLFYYKDRLFQESATSTTQQVRALHPQHVPKFKNMLQRAWGFQTALQTLKLLLC